MSDSSSTATKENDTEATKKNRKKLTMRHRLALFGGMRKDLMRSSPGGVYHFHLKGLLFICTGLIAAVSMTFFLYSAMTGAGLSSDVTFLSWESAMEQRANDSTEQSPGSPQPRSDGANTSTSPTVGDSDTSASVSPEVPTASLRWAALLGAITFGIIWGFIVIITIDRYLTHSMEGIRGFRANFLHAIPRFAVAAVLGIVVSTPLTMLIFQKDISAALTRSISDRLSGIASSYVSSEEMKTYRDAFVAFDGASDEVLEAKRSQLKTAQDQQAAARSDFENALHRYGQELYHGAICGAGPGNGPCAEGLRTAMVNAEEALQTKSDEVGRLSADLSKMEADPLSIDTTAAQSTLTDAREALRRLEDTKIAEYNEAAQDTALLAQLRVMWGSQMDTTMKIAHAVIALLFFLIEVIPVLAQLMWNMREKESQYQKLCRQQDRMLKQRHRLDADESLVQNGIWQEEKEVAFREYAHVQVDAAKDMAQKQLDVLLDANDGITRVQKDRVKRAVEEYNRQFSDLEKEYASLSDIDKEEAPGEKAPDYVDDQERPETGPPPRSDDDTDERRRRDI